MKHILTAVSLAALVAGCSSADDTKIASVATGTAAGCTALTAASLGASEATGKWVDAAGELPAFCEVTAVLTPAEGSNIGVVYRLPAEWNGKVLGIGGGGWAGNVTIEAASEGISKGYATLQTDGGHASTEVWDNSWTVNPEAATDFSHRAIHQMTVAGKQLVQAFYEKPQERAYFQGCSTGGRMALMEAQRYPDDYDAIIAGAPVYTLQVQTSAVLRNNTFARPNAGFSDADLKLAQDAALASCDAADGAKDGLINDPQQCRWDPAEIQCTGAKTATCLSPTQVTTLKTAYDGVRSSDGQWAMFPLTRGGEAGWSRYMSTDGKGTDPTRGGGLLGLKSLLFGSRAVDFDNFRPNVDVPQVRSSAFAAMYEAKDPNLSPFFERGGKLLLWHGENDPGPSPVGTTDYALKVLDGNAAAANSMRYFLMPGVEHCRGGPGADQVGLLDALDAWVSSDKAPDRLIGTRADKSLTRPHCAWPNVAQFGGTGDANDPAGWQCVPRKR